MSISAIYNDLIDIALSEFLDVVTEFFDTTMPPISAGILSRLSPNTSTTAVKRM